MGSLAKMVELASQPVNEDPEETVFHGDVLWFGADGAVKMQHRECGEVVMPPPEVWVNFLMWCHPILEVH